jgi:glutathione S-transferase
MLDLHVFVRFFSGEGNSMLTLIHAPRSRSSGILWMLEELGQRYEVEYVAIRRGDGSGAIDPKNPHPHGKVPVLLDDENVIFERSAIALYLADKFPDARLGPPVSDPTRGTFVTMLAYYCGVIEPAFTSKFLSVSVPRGTAGWVDSDEVMDFINARLAADPYIAGKSFTVADILYAGAFALFMNSPLLATKKTAQLGQYVERCVSRPAYLRSQARDEATN